MCMQCMAGAMTCVGGASSARLWLSTRSWVSARALKRASAGLVVLALLGSGLIGGAPAPSAVRDSSPERGAVAR